MESSAEDCRKAESNAAPGFSCVQVRLKAVVAFLRAMEGRP